MIRTFHVLILSAIVVGCRDPPTPPSKKSPKTAPPAVQAQVGGEPPESDMSLPRSRGA